MSEEEKRANLAVQNNFRKDAEERRSEGASDSKFKEATVAEEGKILMRANYERIKHEEERRRLEEAALSLGISLRSMFPESVAEKTGFESTRKFKDRKRIIHNIIHLLVIL